MNILLCSHPGCMSNASISCLKDPFGKSNEYVGYCPRHASGMLCIPREEYERVCCELTDLKEQVERWQFSAKIEEDGEFCLEWYMDKSNVVTVNMGNDGFSWAAILDGRTHSGRLVPVKATTKVQNVESQLQRDCESK